MYKPKAQVEKERLMARNRKALIEAGKVIGRLTDAQKKTPSQKRSENGRKKFIKRAGLQNVKETFPSDCRGCDEQCGYGHDLEKCYKHSLVVVCGKCGKKVRVRIIPGVDWRYCPVCEVRE